MLGLEPYWIFWGANLGSQKGAKRKDVFCVFFFWGGGMFFGKNQDRVKEAKVFSCF